MTLLDIYKEKLIQTIHNTYNGKINKKWLNDYVSKLISKFTKDKIRVAHCRNIYKYQYHFEKDPNLIPIEIYEDKLNILSNGLLTENTKPVNFQLITKWMDDRDAIKKQSLIAKEKGLEDEYRDLNNKQTTVKQNTNSIYGAATMGTGFVSNIDMGGAITSQARNFISENNWALERFLGANYVFDSFGEAMMYFSQLKDIKRGKFEHLLKDLDYIPTISDCSKKFANLTKTEPKIKSGALKTIQTSFIMFETMSDYDRTMFYYNNNVIELIKRNSKINDLFKNLIDMNVKFINPYKIPEEIKGLLKEILVYISAFCFGSIITHNRVEKYQTRKRKACVIGDTDSTMPTVYEPVENTFKVIGREHLSRNLEKHLTMCMSYAYILDALLKECCYNFVNCCNSYRENDRFFMYMKNEFYFPKVLLFSVKKNYIGIQTVQEGKDIPKEAQLAITGRALGSSGLNEYVSNSIIRLLENDVLRAEKYNPLDVLRGVNEIRDNIIKGIKEGDKSFGVFARFNGINTIKDPERTAAARAGCIWNEIYPLDYIYPGDAMYLFDTWLTNEEDLNGVDDEQLREKIRNVVFRKQPNGLDFSRFGLKTFAVPVDGECVKIPEWIIPFISVNSMVEKHLQPIVSLYSSLLLSPCKYNAEGSSVKKMGSSTLIRF